MRTERGIPSPVSLAALRLRPVVVVSECLGFTAVRYNGQILQDRFVRALASHVDFRPVCPEVGIGLGVPRDPIRIVRIGEENRLVQPSTDRDLTELMHGFSREYLERIGQVDGFILKNRSPSCGIRDVNVYPAEPGKPSFAKTSGLFAEAVLRDRPEVVVEDEGRLTNAHIRHHFLERLFASAELRRVRESGRPAELVRFHSQHKLRVMAHGQAGVRELGRLVAGVRREDFAAAVDAYAAVLARATARPARVPAMVNALTHAFGYVSDELAPAEREHFLGLLEEYRAERLPLVALLAVLQSWMARFGEDYLAAQRLFEPYPRDLFNLADSGARG